jgi:ankyrin repeat protein
MKFTIKLLTFGLLVSIVPIPLWAMEEQEEVRENNQVQEVADLDLEFHQSVVAASLQMIDGNIEPMRVLLKEGISANQIYNFVIPRLNRQLANSEGFVVLLLEFGFDVNAPRMGCRETPLMAAARVGHGLLVRSLIRHGASINGLGMHPMDSSPLIASSSRGQDRISLFLIEQGADINAISRDNESALSSAAFNAHYSTVELLISRGANIEGNMLWRIIRHCTAIFTSRITQPLIPRNLIREANYRRIIKLFLEKNCDANFVIRDESCLCQALACSDVGIVELLLKHKANPNVKLTDGILPILQACGMPYEHRLRNISWKIEGFHQMQPNNLDQHHLDCVHFLLEYGANVDAQDEQGATALMYSAGCIPPIVQKYLKNLADVNYEVIYEELCDGLDLIALAKLLLDHGANRDLKNNEGQTARDIAEKRGNASMVELLDTHNLWASGLKLKAAHAAFARWTVMEARDVQCELNSMPAELREIVTFIAPKAIKDKINGNSSNENLLTIQNVKNDNNQ